MSVNLPPPPLWNIKPPVPTGPPLTAEQQVARDAEWEQGRILQEAVERGVSPLQLMASAIFEGKKADLNLLSGGHTPAPKLPSVTNVTIVAALETLARGAGAPVDYVTFAMLTTAAALMGNNCSVQVSPKNKDWVESIALWSVLIGAPSAGKSPSTKPFEKMLERIEAEDERSAAGLIAQRESEITIAKQYYDDWKRRNFKAIANGESPIPRPPEANIPKKHHAPRSYVMAVTKEALFEVLSYNNNGLLMFRDELAGWIGDMTRYSNSSDRPDWLSMYTGKTINVDRVKYDGEPMRVPNALVSVLGGMQPDRLRELMAGPDDGMLARMVFIWPDAVPLIDFEGQSAAPFFNIMFDRLRRFKNNPHPMYLSSEAYTEFFKLRQHARKLDAEHVGKLHHWIGKGPGLVARIAAVLTVVDWASHGIGEPPREVTVEAVKQACELWAQYLLPMAKRAFGDASRPEIEIKAITLLKEIRKRCSIDHPAVNARDMQRWKLEGMREAKPLAEVLSYLHEAGWLMLKLNYDEVKSGNIHKGRQRGDWLVNPALWSA
ncbi:MAG: DUF3987 domain-containing protein [Hyphomonadaceae bacterium]|nr:DUF3987 domain-containing protein [Hyphomonadaceae bacterium]